MRRAKRRRSRGGQSGAIFSPNWPLIEASPYRARASRPARQLLLSCRATPPLRGGEYVTAISKRHTRAAANVSIDRAISGAADCRKLQVQIQILPAAVPTTAYRKPMARPPNPTLNHSTRETVAANLFQVGLTCGSSV